MTKQCAICGKGSTMGGKRNLLRGKYNPTSHVRKYPNLQWTRLAGSSSRVKVCTRCLKTLAKQAV
ncbi:MAG: 50S ribosomal protein L28 [Candidatus Niyogibacteria bacterium]|nr:50S ribosomal protein L28 [Candidatus Niyogibacteria bacterium]